MGHGLCGIDGLATAHRKNHVRLLHGRILADALDILVGALAARMDEACEF